MLLVCTAPTRLGIKHGGTHGMSSTLQQGLPWRILILGVQVRLGSQQAVSYPGFRNWVPKIGSCKILGRPNF